MLFSLCVYLFFLCQSPMQKKSNYKAMLRSTECLWPSGVKAVLVDTYLVMGPEAFVCGKIFSEYFIFTLMTVHSSFLDIQE